MADQLTAEHFIKPSDLVAPFKPYSEKFTTGQIGNNKFHYVSKEFNQFNRIFGTDVIVEGLNCSVSYSSTKLTININKGKLITDDVFCKINSNTVVVYDNAYIYDPNGYFVLLSDFKNYTTLNRNVFRFMLAYFDSNGNPIDDFDSNRNRIVFGVYQIQKTGSYISSVIEYDHDIISLDHITYTIRKESFDPLIDSFRIDGGVIQ